MVEAVKRGFPQREIADAAFDLQREIDAGRRVVVGVNALHRGRRGRRREILRIDPTLERKQVRAPARRPRRAATARPLERALAAIRERGRRRERQPDAAADRRGPRRGLRGRDRAVAAGGLGRLPRAARLLRRSVAPVGLIHARPGRVRTRSRRPVVRPAAISAAERTTAARFRRSSGDEAAERGAIEHGDLAPAGLNPAELSELLEGFGDRLA